MEKDKKKKTYNFNGKQKANRNDEEGKKRKTQKVSKPKYPLLEKKTRILPLLSFHKYKTNLVEYDHLLNIENKEKQEDNYQDIMSEKRERIENLDQNINIEESDHHNSDEFSHYQKDSDNYDDEAKAKLTNFEPEKSNKKSRINKI